jgi:uracil-DNA glycosylase
MLLARRNNSVSNWLNSWFNDNFFDTDLMPHPSPLNIKWFKDNPDFIKKRIIEIRKIINNTLNKN